MSAITLVEMQEYEKLHGEFHLMAEGTSHPRVKDFESFRALLTGIGNDEPLRLVFERCVRYNRYLELRILAAPYFYDLLLKNGIKP